jgi:hypothetical protein
MSPVRDRTAQPRNRAIVQGVLLPKINLFPSLPGVPQRFSSLQQSLQDFHQPLHGLIRRLKEFLQRLPNYTDTASMAAADQRVGQCSDVVSTRWQGKKNLAKT